MRAGIDVFLEQVASDVKDLPVPAVQLVGALVSMQEGLPPWLSAYVMSQLRSRADMREVSPAALALMTLQAFGKYEGEAFAIRETRLQFEFLCALSLDRMVVVAAQFMEDLVDHLGVLVSAAHIKGDVEKSSGHACRKNQLQAPDYLHH